ncbi:MAG: hypothetical protein NT099_02430 [Candidatus Saganbacteria bacterium]|nr:hypothetical protein [Candidatus Saganbacteria bacterium]
MEKIKYQAPGLLSLASRKTYGDACPAGSNAAGGCVANGGIANNSCNTGPSAAFGCGDGGDVISTELCAPGTGATGECSDGSGGAS